MDYFESDENSTSKNIYYNENIENLNILEDESKSNLFNDEYLNKRNLNKNIVLKNEVNLTKYINPLHNEINCLSTLLCNKVSQNIGTCLGFNVSKNSIEIDKEKFKLMDSKNCKIIKKQIKINNIPLSKLEIKKNYKMFNGYQITNDNELYLLKNKASKLKNHNIKSAIIKLKRNGENKDVTKKKVTTINKNEHETKVTKCECFGLERENLCNKQKLSDEYLENKFEEFLLKRFKKSNVFKKSILSDNEINTRNLNRYLIQCFGLEEKQDENINLINNQYVKNNCSKNNFESKKIDKHTICEFKKNILNCFDSNTGDSKKNIETKINKAELESPYPEKNPDDNEVDNKNNNILNCFGYELKKDEKINENNDKTYSFKEFVSIKVNDNDKLDNKNNNIFNCFGSEFKKEDEKMNVKHDKMYTFKEFVSIKVNDNDSKSYSKTDIEDLSHNSYSDCLGINGKQTYSNNIQFKNIKYQDTTKFVKWIAHESPFKNVIKFQEFKPYGSSYKSKKSRIDSSFNTRESDLENKGLTTCYDDYMDNCFNGITNLNQVYRDEYCDSCSQHIDYD